MSIDPKIWGRPLWQVLETFAFEYPANPTPEQKQTAIHVYDRDVYNFMYCSDCINHWRAMMRRSPPKTQSGNELSRWFVERRNEVGTRLGKRPWTYEETLAAYQQNKKHVYQKQRAQQEKETAIGSGSGLGFDDMNLTIATLLAGVLFLWMWRLVTKPRLF